MSCGMLNRRMMICALMKFAGQQAAEGRGPGSFIPAFLDALYAMNAEVAA